jgi:uncharacterized Zn-finger protein
MPSECVFEAFLIHHYRLSGEGARNEFRRHSNVFLTLSFLSLEEAKNELKGHPSVFLKLSLFNDADCF